jgi:hypothetical protein
MASERIVFDPIGDLRLEVNGHWSFIVCSRALARASPVFEKMFFGGFSESKPTDPHTKWVVKLPEENVDGLEIILNIIHGNVYKIPKTISDHDKVQRSNPRARMEMAWKLLYGVACTADYYDLVEFLRPWANSWLNDACRPFYERSDKKHGCHGEILWVAWVFGDEKLLTLALDKVLSSASIGKGGCSNAGQNDDERDEIYIVNGRGEHIPLYNPQGQENEIILRLLDPGEIEILTASCKR